MMKSFGSVLRYPNGCVMHKILRIDDSNQLITEQFWLKSVVGHVGLVAFYRNLEREKKSLVSK